jgi:pyridoxine 5-phosphate synthase
MRGKLRLGVNIDHVATIRNARGGLHPDPVRAAKLAATCGADGITAHLREDRRHISDFDIERLSREIDLPLNFEMAATEEMLAIALRAKPHAACIVPEKREERTTEGGIRVSLFIEADKRQLDAAKTLGAPVIEIHTGAYCEAQGEERARHLERIVEAAAHAEALGLECHAGHGLAYDSVAPIAAIPSVMELNIGHFLVGEAIFVGLEAAIRRMRQAMDEARGVIGSKAGAR